MKKLILLLITLITLINVSYASFPLSKEIKTEILEISKSENESLSDPFELTGLAIAILIFYLFRASVKTTDPNERKRLRTNTCPSSGAGMGVSVYSKLSLPTIPCGLFDSNHCLFVFTVAP